MKLTLLGVLIALTLSVTGQGTITVEPAFRKKTLYTLSEGETFYQPESKLFFKDNGLQYEFYTSKEGRFRKHTEKGIKGPFKYNPMYPQESHRYWEFQNENGKSTFTHKATGKIYGPYKGASCYNRIGVGKNRQSTGITYLEEGKAYVLIPGKKKYGPYKNAFPVLITSKQTVFWFKDEAEKQYIYKNGKKLGPYQNVRFLYNYKSDEHLNYIYSNQEAWYCSLVGQTFGPFEKIPAVRLYNSSDWQIVVNEPYLDYDKYLLTSSGEKVGIQSQRRSAFRNYQGGWIKIECPELLQNEAPDQEAVKTAEQYLYRSDGTKLGPYNFGPHAPALKLSGVHYAIIGKKHGVKWYEPGNYYVIYDGKEFGPYESVVSNSVQMRGDRLAFIAGIEQTFYLDGAPTQLTNIHRVQLDKYEKAYFAFGQNDGNFSLYHDGKLILEMDERFYGVQECNAGFYVTTGNRQSGHFIHVPNLDEAIGPYNRSKPMVELDKTGKNVAVLDRSDVFINNERVASGFLLRYDPANNSFYWYAREDNNICLYTYELD